MRLICPHCAAVIACADSDCGSSRQCPECFYVVAIPAGRFEPGAVIGDFVIRERIGSGGMGTVYRAEQISLLRPAAVKVMHPSLAASQPQLSRFLKEARIAASIAHPNLIGVYAVGEEDGLHYLAMELVQGQSLHDRIRSQGPLPLEQAAEIVVQVAAGLGAAWNKMHIVHCDIKPENILMPAEGGIKIADLGLAEHGGATPDASAETFGGSPYYVCPEVILGRPLDHRSDLYSLGVTFYEMLTARLPFEGTALAEIAAQHLYAPPPDPRKHVPDLPAGVAAIILRLINKAPEERFQSADELIQAIRVQVLLKTSPELSPRAEPSETPAGGGRWVCPGCSRHNAEISRYCIACGAYGRYPCPLCGEEVVLNSEHCGHCGANLAEQRQGVVRQAESLLTRMDECVSRSDLSGTCRLVAEYRQLDQSILPELVRGQFGDVVAHLGTLFEVKLQEARDALRLDQLEQATTALHSLVSSEQYQWLRDEVDALKKELAQVAFHAGTALKSNCLSTCRRLLSGVPGWQGGTLAARLQELRQQCETQLSLREHALHEAQAIMDAANVDVHDAIQALRDLAAASLSAKVMVLPPDAEDTRADETVTTLREALQRSVDRQVNAWIDAGQWKDLARLVESIRAADDASLSTVEKAVSGRITQEIQERYRAALSAERARDVARAGECWSAVLKVPSTLLPRQIRREGLGFPSRRNRLLTEVRRPLLRSSASAVFFLWCLALSLAVIDLVLAWFAESPAGPVLRSHALPLVLHLTVLALFSRLLHSPGILTSDDLVPGRQPSLFISGLRLLWILSPLNGVFATLCARAGLLVETGQIPDVFGLLATPWMAPGLVVLVWLLVDLRLGWHYRSVLALLGMTLSWILALGVVYLLWDGPPDTPMLQMAAAMYQAVLFALLQTANWLWFRGWSRPPRGSHSGPAATTAAVAGTGR